MSISPDSSYWVVVYWDGSAQVIDARTRAPVGDRIGGGATESERIIQLEISPDGGLAVRYDDGSVEFMELRPAPPPPTERALDVDGGRSRSVAEEEAYGRVMEIVPAPVVEGGGASNFYGLSFSVEEGGGRFSMRRWPRTQEEIDEVMKLAREMLDRNHTRRYRQGGFDQLLRELEAECREHQQQRQH